MSDVDELLGRSGNIALDVGRVGGRSIERLNELRAAMVTIADRLLDRPEGPTLAEPAAAAFADAMERFGEAFADMHEGLEHLATAARALEQQLCDATPRGN